MKKLEKHEPLWKNLKEKRVLNEASKSLRNLNTSIPFIYL